MKIPENTLIKRLFSELDKAYADMTIHGFTVRIYRGDFECEAHDGIAPEWIHECGKLSDDLFYSIIAKEHGSETVNEFEAIARPLIKFLCDNHNPHASAIITPTSAEIVEGVMSIGNVTEYIRD
jgi:hypothetical protein